MDKVSFVRTRKNDKDTAERDIKTLSAFGFKVGEEYLEDSIFGIKCVRKVYTDEIEGKKVLNTIELEFNSFEDFLAFADKWNMQLIYSDGTWELFNDPYAFC